MEAAEAAIEAAKTVKIARAPCTPSPAPSSTPSRTSRRRPSHTMPEAQQRWYAIKIFERDEKVLEQMNLFAET